MQLRAQQARKRNEEVDIKQLEIKDTAAGEKNPTAPQKDSDWKRLLESRGKDQSKKWRGRKIYPQFSFAWPAEVIQWAPGKSCRGTRSAFKRPCFFSDWKKFQFVLTTLLTDATNVPSRDFFVFQKVYSTYQQ